MDDELAERISEVYPKGLLHDPDFSRLGASCQDDRLRDVLDEVARRTDVAVHYSPKKSRPSYTFGLTQRGDPEFNSWLWSMTHQNRLQWSRCRQRPYVVLWLDVSRVVDYYDLYFNYWMPKAGTNFMDLDYRPPPTPAWRERERHLVTCLEDRGFRLAPRSLLQEVVPFVLAPDWKAFPEDDPRWLQDGFEPPLAPVHVFDCIFEEE